MYKLGNSSSFVLVAFVLGDAEFHAWVVSVVMSYGPSFLLLVFCWVGHPFRYSSGRLVGAIVREGFIQTAMCVRGRRWRLACWLHFTSFLVDAGCWLHTVVVTSGEGKFWPVLAARLPLVPTLALGFPVYWIGPWLPHAYFRLLSSPSVPARVLGWLLVGVTHASSHACSRCSSSFLFHVSIPIFFSVLIFGSAADENR